MSTITDVDDHVFLQEESHDSPSPPTTRPRKPTYMQQSPSTDDDDEEDFVDGHDTRAPSSQPAPPTTLPRKPTYMKLPTPSTLPSTTADPLSSANPGRVQFATKDLSSSGRPTILPRKPTYMKLVPTRAQPPPPRLIVFVCTGNTCRSPMAEVLFRQKLSQTLGCSSDALGALGWQVASAGVAAGRGGHAAHNAQQVMASRGLDLSGHQARSLTPELIEQAWRVVGLTPRHRAGILEQWPQAEDKVVLLDQAGVPDPICGSLQVYEACADHIDQRLDVLLEDLGDEVTPVMAVVPTGGPEEAENVVDQSQQQPQQEQLRRQESLSEHTRSKGFLCALMQSLKRKLLSPTLCDTCQKEHAGKGCLGHSLRSFARTFVVAFGVRSAISIVLHVLKLLWRTRGRGLSWESLFGERNLVFRVTSVRLATFVAGYVAIFQGMGCALRRIRGCDGPVNSIISGFAASLSSLALDRSSRETYVLYMLARVCQSTYNSAKEKGLIHRYVPFADRLIANGDSLLFALSCGQIMYAYVMRPKTLPPSYWRFIVNIGPQAPAALEAVRCSNRDHEPVDASSLLTHTLAVCDKKFGANNYTPPSPPTPELGSIGCDYLHPMHETCSSFALQVFADSFLKAAVVYLVPNLAASLMVPKRRHQMLSSPHWWAAYVAMSVARSSLFLGVFPMLFQGMVCGQRKIWLNDHKSVYYVAGLIAAFSSIHLEVKSRRSELALYTLPRAVDSAFKHLQSRGLVSRSFSPFGSLLMFASCMASLMYFWHWEPATLSPLVKTLFRQFLHDRQEDVAEKADRGREAEEREEGRPAEKADRGMEAEEREEGTAT